MANMNSYNFGHCATCCFYCYSDGIVGLTYHQKEEHFAKLRSAAKVSVFLVEMLMQ